MNGFQNDKINKFLKNQKILMINKAESSKVRTALKSKWKQGPNLPKSRTKILWRK